MTDLYLNDGLKEHIYYSCECPITANRAWDYICNIVNPVEVASVTLHRYKEKGYRRFNVKFTTIYGEKFSASFIYYVQKRR